MVVISSPQFLLLRALLDFQQQVGTPANRFSVDGRVVYRYKQPFRDGSKHVVLEPLDFIARLAARVPKPRLNLTRFHGVFAPNFKYRTRIVPRQVHVPLSPTVPVSCNEYR